MTTPNILLPVGPLSPYVTPDILTGAPTGIAWSTIPPGKTVTPAQRFAEQSNIVQRATSQVDGYCNQPLRATLDTEYFNGPDYRVTFQPATGNIRIMTQRSPVLSVVAIQYTPNFFPHQWLTVPTGYYEPEYLPIGVDTSSAPSSSGSGGDSIIMGAGFVDWGNGRNGYRIKVSYINGWPHCGITSAVSAGGTTVTVDDVTGFATSGPTGAIIYDSGQQEVVSVTSAVSTLGVTSAAGATGPGTLTLAAGMQFSHPPGTLLTTIPASVMWATIQYSTAQALTRGATSTTVHEIPGGGGGGGRSISELIAEAELALQPYKRVI